MYYREVNQAAERALYTDDPADAGSLLGAAARKVQQHMDRIQGQREEP